MKILENASLADIVYYRIGGNARYVLLVTSFQDLQAALTFCKDQRIDEIRIVGMGANVILPDQDFNGAVIVLEGDGSGFEMKDKERIKAFAGERMNSLLTTSFAHNLIGLEWAGGLPSSVGGAVRGNAGAFGSEIKDSIVMVEAIDCTDPSFTIKEFTRTDCHFAYRHSYFKDHPELIIISATFQLKKGSVQEVADAKAVYQRNIDYRQTHHPMEFPSCGSVFQNIIDQDKVKKIIAVWPDIRELSETKWHQKISMGYVVNRLGFSGKKHGGAMVSPKHTNYIVNVDHAKASDVRSLIKEIQEAFYQTFGFIPEPEVMVISEK